MGSAGRCDDAKDLSVDMADPDHAPRGGGRERRSGRKAGASIGHQVRPHRDARRTPRPRDAAPAGSLLCGRRGDAALDLEPAGRRDRSSVPMAAGARSRTSAAPRPGSLTRRAGDQSGPSCAVCYRVLSGIRLQNVYPYGDRLHRPTTSRPLRGGAGPPARRRSWLGPRPPARGRGFVGGRYGLHGLAVGGNRGAVSAADRGGVGVRGACRNGDAVQLGTGPGGGWANCNFGCDSPWAQRGDTPGKDGAGRFVPFQRLGSARHARQCVGVG